MNTIRTLHPTGAAKTPASMARYARLRRRGKGAHKPAICYGAGMEQIAPWITPAIVVALFVWLRSDIRDLRRDLTTRLDSLDKRLRAVEAGLAELRGRFDGIDGQLAFLRDFVTRRNDLTGQPAEAGADE